MRCRSCGGSEFFTKEVAASGGYGPNLLPIDVFSGAKFRIRICGSCGLVEWFVPERFLDDVREQFTGDSDN